MFIARFSARSWLEWMIARAEKSLLIGEIILYNPISKVATRYFFLSPLPLVRYLEIVLPLCAGFLRVVHEKFVWKDSICRKFFFHNKFILETYFLTIKRFQKAADKLMDLCTIYFQRLSKSLLCFQNRFSK